MDKVRITNMWYTIGRLVGITDGLDQGNAIKPHLREITNDLIVNFGAIEREDEVGKDGKSDEI